MSKYFTRVRNKRSKKDNDSNDEDIEETKVIEESSSEDIRENTSSSTAPILIAEPTKQHKIALTKRARYQLIIHFNNEEHIIKFSKSTPIKDIITVFKNLQEGNKENLTNSTPWNVKVIYNRDDPINYSNQNIEEIETLITTIVKHMQNKCNKAHLYIEPIIDIIDNYQKDDNSIVNSPVQGIAVAYPSVVDLQSLPSAQLEELSQELSTLSGSKRKTTEVPTEEPIAVAMAALPINADIIAAIAIDNVVDAHVISDSDSDVIVMHPSSPDQISEGVTKETGEDLGIVGLKNLRMTCFVNVVLQSLSNSKPIRQFIEQLPEVKADKSLVFLELKYLLAAMWSGQLNDVSPLHLITTIQSKGIQYEIGTEEDADWFLHVLLQIIDEELTSILGSEYSILKLFSTTKISEATCPSCNKVTTLSTEETNIYTLYLPEVPRCTLQDCLNMEDNLDLFHCNFCQSNHNNIIRRTWLSKLPPVLCFHFNRNKWTGKVLRRATRSAAKAKIQTAVTSPSQLDMTDYTKQQIEKSKYSLAAIIVHEGLTPITGHYYTFCFNENQGKWYKFDDNRKPVVVTEKVLGKANPFMLFYVQS